MWQVCIYVVLVKGKNIINIESSDQVTNERKVEGLNKQKIQQSRWGKDRAEELVGVHMMNS